MDNLIVGVIFLLLAILGVVLKKTYYALPERELKRRAEKHIEDEVVLYRAVAYGNSLRVLLWIYIGLTAAVSFILFAKVMPLWLGLLIIAPLLYLVFSLLPSTEVSSLGLRLTRYATPTIVRILSYLHPVLFRSSNIVSGRYIPGSHTGLYERHDLFELIEKQQKQSDSRLSHEELEIVKRALLFSDKKVSDVLTPRKKVKTLMADDTVGPILIDELHATSQEHVLVKESKKGPVVGTLAFKGLGIKSHGKVKDVMDEKLYYLNEDDNLSEALKAFIATNHDLFVVVNSFEEYVGIVTIGAIIRELLGNSETGDFEDYTSIKAVSGKYQNKASQVAEEEAVAESNAEEPVNTDEEVVE